MPFSWLEVTIQLDPWASSRAQRTDTGKEPLYISYVHVYPRSLATVDVKLKTSGPLDGISLRWRLDDAARLEGAQQAGC